MRHRILTTVLGTLLLMAVPSVAAAVPPAAPDGEIAKSVLDIDANAATLDIDLDASVSPLESEQAQGSKVTVSISADVLFDFNQATLTDAARSSLARLAPRLRDTSGAVLVGGHSDSIGANAYNLVLSQKRADVVAAELRRLVGSKATVNAKGYGSSRPVAPNTVKGKDNPDGRAKNRRVEITFQSA